MAELGARSVEAVHESGKVGASLLVAVGYQLADYVGDGASVFHLVGGEVLAGQLLDFGDDLLDFPLDFLLFLRLGCEQVVVGLFGGVDFGNCGLALFEECRGE